MIGETPAAMDLDDHRCGRGARCRPLAAHLGRDDLLWHAQALQRIPRGHLVPVTGLCQGGLDVLADLGHQLDAPVGAERPCRSLQATEIVADQFVSLHRCLHSPGG